MTEITIDFSENENFKKIQELCEKVYSDIEKIGNEGDFSIEFDLETEEQWDASNEVTRKENRSRILSEIFLEEEVKKLHGLFLISGKSGDLLATMIRSESKDWNVQFLDYRLREFINEDEIDIPQYPLRLNGISGFYKIEPNGNIEYLDSEPKCYGPWQCIDINDMAVLRVRLDGTEEDGDVNDEAMKIIKNHDISEMNSDIEERLGFPLIIYGDVFVEEFDE